MLFNVFLLSSSAQVPAPAGLSLALFLISPTTYPLQPPTTYPLQPPTTYPLQPPRESSDLTSTQQL